jgi:hypothetical protein
MDARRALREVASAIDAWQDGKALDRLSFVDQGLVNDVRRILGEVGDPEPRVLGDELADVDGAVRALLEHDGSTVSAWVVVAGIERLEPGVRPEISPLEHRLDYAVSAGTSPALALGLTDAVAGKLRRLTRDAFVGEE